MDLANRKYVIIQQIDISKIDYTEVLQTSPDMVRLSLDGTLGIIKYDGDMPWSVSILENKSREFNHQEIIELLDHPDWTPTVNS